MYLAIAIVHFGTRNNAELCTIQLSIEWTLVTPQRMHLYFETSLLQRVVKKTKQKATVWCYMAVLQQGTVHLASGVSFVSRLFRPVGHRWLSFGGRFSLDQLCFVPGDGLSLGVSSSSVIGPVLVKVVTADKSGQVHNCPTTSR